MPNCDVKRFHDFDTTHSACLVCDFDMTEVHRLHGDSCAPLNGDSLPMGCTVQSFKIALVMDSVV